MLVLGLNEPGELFAYYNLAARPQQRSRLAIGMALPGSVVLDETLGHEWFFLLWSPTPVSVAEFQRAVKAQHTTYETAKLPGVDDQASRLVNKVAR